MKLLLFFGGWVIYDSLFVMLASDAFWNNLGANVTAIGTVLVLLGTTYVGFQANKAKKNAADAKAVAEESKVVIDELHKTTNSKMDALLKAKDDLAKGLEDTAKIKAMEEASYNRGKIETLEQLKTEDALRKTPPEK